MNPDIIPRFTANNQLVISLENLNLEHGSFKLCFSLVYSIQSLKGARILKQIGRYYELETKDNELLIDLQIPRTGSYNLSCGPEGIFIINSANELIKVKLHELKFDKEIKLNNYEDSQVNKFVPIIPAPRNTNFSDNFININKTKFKFNNSSNKEIIDTLSPYLNSLNIEIGFNEGFPIIFSQDDLKNEEYKLFITEEAITIHSSSYSGKFYALITLVQLIYFYQNKLPICKIEDLPEFSWRGMHLDCSRQFYTIEEIKRLMNYMALFKLNRFHWHLTDNEAWRINLNSYPDLTRNGSYRGYELLIPSLYGSGYHKYGGSYSSVEIRELVDYAKKLNIEIMPEIDLPAHSWALVQVMPSLIDQSSNYKSEDVGNYPNNTINPSLEDTWKFLNNIFDEISKYFPFEIFHVGVDERPKESWEGSPKIHEYMKNNNLNNFDEVQDHYMNKVIKILKKNHKRTAAWNEAALSPHNDIGSSGSAGKIDKSCLIFAWEHPDVAIESTSRGFDTILCPGQKTYFDMAYNNSTSERGICWAATIETKDIHSWRPLNNLTEENKKFVKGVQGQLWSETITNKEYFDQMINPRLATLSEIAWSSYSRRSWPEFRTSLLSSVKLLSTLGWNFHKF